MRLLQFDGSWVSPRHVVSIEPRGAQANTPHSARLTLVSGRVILTSETVENAAELINRELAADEITITGSDGR